MAIRVMLADDHKIIREGLSSLVDSKPDLEVIGAAQNGREAIEMAAELRPDVIVMDVGMPDLNGVEATRKILEDNPHMKIIALSMHADRQYVSRMLEAGACGYLLKDCAFEELDTAVHTVVDNKTYLSPTIAGTVVQDYVSGGGPSVNKASVELTPREREVIQLIAEGKSTKEVAFKLDVSVKTIETHRRNMMEKLEVDSVAELTKYAIREGLTSLED